MPMKSVIAWCTWQIDPMQELNGPVRSAGVSWCSTAQTVVVLTGRPDSIHVPSARFPAPSGSNPTSTDFDERFLRSHRLAW